MFGNGSVRRGIPSESFKPTMIREIGEYLHIVSTQLGIAPPYVVAVSLLGVRGLGLIREAGADAGHEIDRDNLLIPDLIR